MASNLTSLARHVGSLVGFGSLAVRGGPKASSFFLWINSRSVGLSAAGPGESSPVAEMSRTGSIFCAKVRWSCRGTGVAVFAAIQPGRNADALRERQGPSFAVERPRDWPDRGRKGAFLRGRLSECHGTCGPVRGKLRTPVFPLANTERCQKLALRVVPRAERDWVCMMHACTVQPANSRNPHARAKHHGPRGPWAQITPDHAARLAAPTGEPQRARHGICSSDRHENRFTELKVYVSTGECLTWSDF